MSQQPRRTGRPTKAPEPGARASLGLKVTSTIKQRLDEAARANGRTQSQEAEARLERSFVDEDLLPQLLDLAYGRETAALLLILGECIKPTAEQALFYEKKTLEGAGPWMSAPWAFHQVREAVNLVLDALQPEGAESAPMPKLVQEIAHATPAAHRVAFERLGQSCARGVLAAVGREEKSAGALEQRLAPARARLAGVLEAKRRGARHGR